MEKKMKPRGFETIEALPRFLEYNSWQSYYHLIFVIVNYIVYTTYAHIAFPRLFLI